MVQPGDIQSASVAGAVDRNDSTPFEPTVTATRALACDVGTLHLNCGFAYRAHQLVAIEFRATTAQRRPLATPPARAVRSCGSPDPRGQRIDWLTAGAHMSTRPSIFVARKERS